MTNTLDAYLEPVITIKGDEAFANSRDVAAAFGKNHRDVLRAIDNLLEQEAALGLRHFAQTPYIEPSTGQTYRSYDMNRDGFTLLAMGFNGPKALKWKLRYIDAFNAMEAELRSRPAAVPDLSDPEVLVQLLTEHAGKRIEAEQRAQMAERQIEEVRPKASFYDQFVNADGLYGLQNAASVLNEPPNKFIGWLKQTYLFYQGGFLVPRANYRRQGIFEVKATMVDDKARYRTFVTPKGIRYLAGKLHKHCDLLGRVAR